MNPSIFKNTQQFPVNKEFCLVPGKWRKVSQSDIITLLDSMISLFYNNLDRKLIPSKKVYVINASNRPDPVNHPEIMISKDYDIIYLYCFGVNYYSYAYQFAHELCHHILGSNSHFGKFAWFAETICELSSVFMIDLMSNVWKKNPPHPEWRNYSSNLRSYLNFYLQSPRHKHKNDFNEWLSRNIEGLYKNPYLRGKNKVAAQLLFPYFKQQPELWASLQYLNNFDVSPQMTFNEFLNCWQMNAPGRHHSAVSNFKQLLHTNEKPSRTQKRTAVASAAAITPTAVPLADLVKSFSKKTSSFEVFKSIIKELFGF